MNEITLIGLILGSSWASGINLYLTMAGLGIAHRMEWIVLPGDLEILSHPLVIGFALIVYVIEFIADKVPYVDNIWDSVHTFIRPAGGALIAYLALPDSTPFVQASMAIVGGAIALDSHLAKATTRVAINASPEPVSNSIASLTEDVTVLGVLWLIINHPVVIGILVIAFVVFSIWFLPKMFRLFKKGLNRLFQRKGGG